MANLPEAITRSPLLRKKRIKAEAFAGYVQDVLRLFTPELLPRLMSAMVDGVEKGDAKIMRLVAEMYRLVDRGGISIVNTLIQGTAVSSDVYDRCFDGIVAKLDRAERALDVEAEPEPQAEVD